MRTKIEICVMALLLAACGGGEAATDDGIDDTETSGAEDTTAAAAADVAWPDMDREQRFAYMQNTVMPEMQALFQAHDAERYADFGCATCHGENAQEVGFEMPNGLAPLAPANVGAMFGSEEPMPQFMVQTVWPRMTELLGAAPYDPETHEGFGCFGCHAMDEG